MSTYVFTGRFQPLHLGHISFIRRIKELYPSDLLIICILRNSGGDITPKTLSPFHTVSINKQTAANNPLPNWNRYMLVSLAIKNDPILRNNTEIIFRNRSDIDWEDSIMDLPEDRIWVFPQNSREEFDSEKIRYYQGKEEKIQLIESTDYSSMYSGTIIRDSLRAGDRSFNFLPSSCVDYFQQECLRYFIN